MKQMGWSSLARAMWSGGRGYFKEREVKRRREVCEWQG
jgi:hypothetical protein